MYYNVNKTEGFWYSFKQRKDEPHQDKKSSSSHSDVLTFLKKNEKYSRVCSETRFNFRASYTYEHSQLYFQRDGYSCGVFVCIFVDAYLKNVYSVASDELTQDVLLIARHTILKFILQRPTFNTKSK